MIWVKLAGELILRLIKWFIMDKNKQEEYEREVQKELEDYQKEADTSANIRDEARDARERLKERNK